MATSKERQIERDRRVEELIEEVKALKEIVILLAESNKPDKKAKK